MVGASTWTAQGVSDLFLRGIDSLSMSDRASGPTDTSSGLALASRRSTWKPSAGEGGQTTCENENMLPYW